ncbi:hypothetical protein, partial [Acinetobacter baumannii]
MSSASQLNNKQEEAMKYTQGPLLVKVIAVIRCAGIRQCCT